MEGYGRFGDTAKRFRRNLKQMVSEGIQPLGMVVSIPSPFMVDIAAVAGYDYIWIDMEHNLFNPESICNLIRAADSAGMPTMARIADLDLVLPLMDFGMIGFTFPHVGTAEQAREIVRMVRYAPQGRRGYCTGGRAMRFGAMPFDRYTEEIGEEAIITIMIEDEEGIQNYKEILAVPGIDYLRIGAGDFAQGLGHLLEPEHPDVVAKREEIYAWADRLGIRHDATGAPTRVAEDKSVLLNGLIEAIARHRGK